MNFLRKEDFKDINKEKNFINKNYDIHSAIILNNIGRPKYTFVDGNKDFKVCRFCGKTQDDVTFNNRSHVVPKLLGNFLVVSNFECDVCNSYFSKYETELEKYIKIPLIANLRDKELKNRFAKNIQRVDGEISLTGKKEKVEFNGIYVLKILLKFAMSMLKEDEIDDYKNIINILLNEEIPFITNILDITTKTPFDWNSVILYENNLKDDNLVDNILVLNFNMKKYVIFFNRDGKEIDITDRHIDKYYIDLFSDKDIYNYRLRDFNNPDVQIKFNLDIFMNFIKNI